jgi:hypothetical protein
MLCRFLERWRSHILRNRFRRGGGFEDQKVCKTLSFGVPHTEQIGELVPQVIEVNAIGGLINQNVGPLIDPVPALGAVPPKIG